MESVPLREVVLYLPVKDIKVCESVWRRAKVLRTDDELWEELLQRDRMKLGSADRFAKCLLPHDAYIYRRTGAIPEQWWNRSARSAAHTSTLLTRHAFALASPSGAYHSRRLTRSQKAAGTPLLIAALPVLFGYTVAAHANHHAKRVPKSQFARWLTKLARLVKKKWAALSNAVRIKIFKRLRNTAANIRRRASCAYHMYIRRPIVGGTRRLKKRYLAVKSAFRKAVEKYVKQPACRAKERLVARWLKTRAAVQRFRRRMCVRTAAVFGKYVKRPAVRVRKWSARKWDSAKEKTAHCKTIAVDFAKRRVQRPCSELYRKLRLGLANMRIRLRRRAARARAVSRRLYHVHVRGPCVRTSQRLKKKYLAFKSACGRVMEKYVNQPTRRAKEWWAAKWVQICAAGARVGRKSRRRTAHYYFKYVKRPAKRVKKWSARKWDSAKEKVAHCKTTAVDFVKRRVQRPCSELYRKLRLGLANMRIRLRRRAARARAVSRRLYYVHVRGPCVRTKRRLRRKYLALKSACEKVVEKYVKQPASRVKERWVAAARRVRVLAAAAFGRYVKRPVVRVKRWSAQKWNSAKEKAIRCKTTAVDFVKRHVQRPCSELYRKLRLAAKRVYARTKGRAKIGLKKYVTGPCGRCKERIQIKVSGGKEVCAKAHTSVRAALRKVSKQLYLWYNKVQPLTLEEAVRLEHYDLGDMGGILKVSLRGTYQQLHALDMNIAAAQPYPVILFDRSASMGLWCHAALTKALPKAIHELGYSWAQPVTVLAFNGGLETYHTKLGQLGSLDITARGGTNILGALQSLVGIINSNNVTGAALNVLVLSDGQVADKEAAVKFARENVSAQCRCAVNVSLLRIETRRDDTPDTRAMACVGAFSTTGRTEVIDIDLCDELPGSERGVALIHNAVHESMAGNSSITTTLCVGGGVASLPSITSQDAIAVSTAQECFVYVPERSLRSAVVGGLTAEVHEMGRPKTEEVLVQSLLCLENQLKIWQVVGTSAGAGEADVGLAQGLLVKWLQSLSKLMSDVPVETLRVGVRDRVRNIIVAAERRKKSMCARLLQMSNADAVTALNSAQQADYLRSSVTKQTKKLACRAKLKDADLEFDELCRNVVLTTCGMALPAEDKEEDVSFYSQTSMCETLQAVQDMRDLADITADELLRVAGGLGVPYRAFVAEYPDPWQYRIAELYTGMLINESDLWTAHNQGYGAALECPGRHGSTITGVLPLDDGAGMMFYNTKMRDLAELQAAVCMRRKMARVAGDVAAREAAGALYCVQLIGVNGTRATNELEVASVMLNSMARRINRSTALRELTVQLRGVDDIRTELLGRNEVSNILKPAVCLVRGMVEGTLPSDRLLPQHCRALYELDAYHAAKKALVTISRSNQVMKMLGINAEDCEAVCPSASHLKEYMNRHAQWVPSLESVACLYRVAKLPPVVTPEVLECLPSVTLHEAYGFEGDVEMYKVGTVLMALECAKEQDRVKDGTCRTPVLASESDVWEYIKNTVERTVDALRREAERVVAEKLAEAAGSALLTELVCCKYEKFVLLLLAIKVRGSREFSKLMRLLLGGGHVGVTDAKDKLFYMLTGIGRDGKGADRRLPPCRHILKLKKKATCVLGVEGWMELLTAHAEQSTKGYTYRESCLNRHKHGNDKPSFYALGYQSLAVMQELDPAGYAKYVKVHVDCCGFKHTYRRPVGC